jgi:hypothetical protein
MLAVARLLSSADAILRGEISAFRSDPIAGNRPLAAILGVILAFGLFYGAVMGSYGIGLRSFVLRPASGPAATAPLTEHGPRSARGPETGRLLQVVYSAVKVPILLLVTFGLSLPSFFVVNTLFGLRDDFPRVVRALLSTQAGLTVVLASLAPITAFVYVSGISYRGAILFNGLMFGTASISGQWLLRRDYRPLIAANPRHRLLLKIWLAIFVFVGVQLGWTLRPFIGDPRAPVQFFREDSFGNAYVVVLEMIWNVLAGG